MMEVKASATVVIMLRDVNVSNQHSLHLQLQQLHVNYLSINRNKEVQSTRPTPDLLGPVSLRQAPQ